MSIVPMNIVSHSVFQICVGANIILPQPVAFVYIYFRGGSGSELSAKERKLGSGPVSLGLFTVNQLLSLVGDSENYQ